MEGEKLACAFRTSEIHGIRLAFVISLSRDTIVSTAYATNLIYDIQ